MKWKTLIAEVIIVGVGAFLLFITLRHVPIQMRVVTDGERYVAQVKGPYTSEWRSMDLHRTTCEEAYADGLSWSNALAHPDVREVEPQDNYKNFKPVNCVQE